MPLTPDQETLEHEWRVEQMNANILKLRAETDKARMDLKYENRKFAVQLVAGLATAFAAGVGALALVLHYAVHP